MAEEPEADGIKNLGLKGLQVVPVKEQPALVIVPRKDVVERVSEGSQQYKPEDPLERRARYQRVIINLI